MLLLTGPPRVKSWCGGDFVPRVVETLKLDETFFGGNDEEEEVAVGGVASHS